MDGGAGGVQEPRRGEEEEAGRQTRVAEVGGGGGMKFRVSARAPHGVGALLLIGGAVVAGAGVVAWRRAKRDRKLPRKEEKEEEEVFGGGGVVEDGKGGTVAPEIDQPDVKVEHGALAPEIDQSDDDKVEDGSPSPAPEIDQPGDEVDDGALAPEIDQPGDKVEGGASAQEIDQPVDDKVEDGASAPEIDQPGDDKVEDGTLAPEIHRPDDKVEESSPAPEIDLPGEEIEDGALAPEINRPGDEVDGSASPQAIDRPDDSLMAEVEKTEIGSNGLDNGGVAEVHHEEEIVADELDSECAEESDLDPSKNTTEIPVHDDADSKQIEKLDESSIPNLPEVSTHDMDTVAVEEVEENSTKEDTEIDHNSIKNDNDNDQSLLTNHIQDENASNNNLKEEHIVDENSSQNNLKEVIATKENEDVEVSDECSHSKNPRIVLDEQITSDAAQEAESMENSPTAKLMVDPEQLMDDHNSLKNDTNNDQCPNTNHTEDENSSKNDLKEENIVEEIATNKNEDVEEASSKSPRIILDEQITSDGAQEAESMENSPTAQLMMHPEQILDDMATDTESNAAEDPEATVPNDEDVDQQEQQEPDGFAGSPALPPSPVKPTEEKEPEVIETGMKIEQDYANGGLKERGVITNSKRGAAVDRRSSSVAILALMLALIVLGIAVAVQLYAPQHATKVLMDLQGAVEYVNNKWQSRSA